MDREAWQVTVQEVTLSQTRLSTHALHEREEINHSRANLTVSLERAQARA